MEKRIAICPGSFDPITKGHLDIIRRAANLFDEVIVLIMVNYTKTNTAFTAAERVEMARRVTADIPNVRVDYYVAGLLADYARQQGACTLVKGLRAVTDFEYEFQMALTNKKLYPNLETLFLTTDIQYMYLSSSVVRQVASFGGDISEFVCPELLEDIQKRLAPAPGVLPRRLRTHKNAGGFSLNGEKPRAFFVSRVSPAPRR